MPTCRLWRMRLSICWKPSLRGRCIFMLCLCSRISTPQAKVTRPQRICRQCMIVTLSRSLFILLVRFLVHLVTAPLNDLTMQDQLLCQSQSFGRMLLQCIGLWCHVSVVIHLFHAEDSDMSRRVWRSWLGGHHRCDAFVASFPCNGHIASVCRREHKSTAQYVHVSWYSCDSPRVVWLSPFSNRFTLLLLLRNPLHSMVLLNLKVT